MIWTSDDLSPREQEIVKHIKQLVEDTSCDMFNHGYDEGYEAADPETAYDRGWNAALESVMDMVEPSGLFPTPASKKDMGVILEAYHDKSVLVLKAYMNYLAEQIESLEK